MRAVVDANVHVSALIGTGPPARFMTAWAHRLAFDLIVCPQLIVEINNVLDRAHVRRRLPLAAADLHLLTDAGLVQPAASVSATRNIIDASQATWPSTLALPEALPRGRTGGRLCLPDAACRPG